MYISYTKLNTCGIRRLKSKRKGKIPRSRIFKEMGKKTKSKRRNILEGVTEENKKDDCDRKRGS
jgi:hypothetical protein